MEIDKYELARKYYSEDNNSLCDFVDYLDEYLKLTSDNSDYAVPPSDTPKLPSLKDVIDNTSFYIPEYHVEEVYNEIKELGNFV